MIDLGLQKVDLKSLRSLDNEKISALKTKLEAGQLSKPDFINQVSDIKLATLKTVQENGLANLAHLTELRASLENDETRKEDFKLVIAELTKVHRELIKVQNQIDQVQNDRAKQLGDQKISVVKEQYKLGKISKPDYIIQVADLKIEALNTVHQNSLANLARLNELKASLENDESQKKMFNEVRAQLTKVKKDLLKEQIKMDRINNNRLKKITFKKQELDRKLEKATKKNEKLYVLFVILTCGIYAYLKSPSRIEKLSKEKTIYDPFVPDEKANVELITNLDKQISKNEEALTLLMNFFEKKAFAFMKFIYAIPGFFKNLGKGIVKFIIKFFLGIINWFKDIGLTFWRGDWKTKVSYFVMGFGSVARGQWLRGILFFVFEVVFILFLALFGGKYLGQLYILGTKETITLPDGTVIQGDNSFTILLYGVLTLFFIAAFIYTWYLNIKQNRIAEEIIKDEKKLDGAKDDLRALVDKNFHKTLLALPTVGIVIFTILPIFFMILVAFTDYDAQHATLFGWAGLDNFQQLFVFQSGGKSFSMTFGQILLWTLVWAFFATFTNYFLGMLVAMLINKKGIKLKKLWRTVLVFSIAIPQFISILYVSQMFATDGVINGIFEGIAKLFGNNNYQPIDFWGDPWLARITVIIINIWIGVPYLMLVVTGILMNIPADLYESANIDGANAWQQYSKITLPYMLFITGPYLLTSFTGNMNNFNVIYLLTGGGPINTEMYGNAGSTDLLITWLYSLAVNKSDYKFAAVIGIMVFIVVAVISLVVYNLIPSTKNEEEFQ